jgi:hypothetical protein
LSCLYAQPGDSQQPSCQVLRSLWLLCYWMWLEWELQRKKKKASTKSMYCPVEMYLQLHSKQSIFSFQACLQCRRSIFWMQSVHSRGSKGYIALCGSWSWSEFMFVRFFRHFVHALVVAKVQIVNGGRGWNRWNLILSYQIVTWLFEYDIVLHFCGGFLLSSLLLWLESWSCWFLVGSFVLQ